MRDMGCCSTAASQLSLRNAEQGQHASPVRIDLGLNLYRLTAVGVRETQEEGEQQQAM